MRAIYMLGYLYGMCRYAFRCGANDGYDSLPSYGSKIGGEAITKANAEHYHPWRNYSPLGRA